MESINSVGIVHGNLVKLVKRRKNRNERDDTIMDVDTKVYVVGFNGVMVAKDSSLRV